MARGNVDLRSRGELYCFLGVEPVGAPAGPLTCDQETRAAPGC